MVHNLTPLNEPFNQLSAQWSAAIRNFSHLAGDPAAAAAGQIQTMLVTQSRILAYSDMFLACAVLAFAMIPFCFLLSSTKSSGKAGAH
jgi:DHA2 family multidrug resistance protein